MSRLKVAAQLIKDNEHAMASKMLERDENSYESFYWRSLIFRLLDRYDQEEELIKKMQSQFQGDEYFRSRQNWHNLPMFEKMVPRQSMSLPRNSLTTPTPSMVEQTCFVTGGDANFFELIVECIESIRNTTLYKDCAICIFDCGLTDDQKHILSTKYKVASIVDPGWDIECETFHRYSPSRKETFTRPFKEFEGAKAHVSRLFTKKHFPGYRYYFWIDADAWVQDERSIDLFLDACTRQYCAGAIHCNQSIKNAGFLDQPMMEPEEKAIFEHKNTFTGGVTCIDGNTPFFDEVGSFLKKCVKKYDYAYALDEAAINYVFYKFNFKEILPYECNYRFATGIPVTDINDQQVLRNPITNKIVGILHLPSVQKEKYYYNTLALASPINTNEMLQQHQQQSNKSFFDPNHKINPDDPQVSLRFRVWPWKDKEEMKMKLMNEVRNV